MKPVHLSFETFEVSLDLDCICTSNPMFHESDLSQKLPEPNMWLLIITLNQQTLFIKTNIF